MALRYAILKINLVRGILRKWSDKYGSDKYREICLNIETKKRPKCSDPSGSRGDTKKRSGHIIKGLLTDPGWVWREIIWPSAMVQGSRCSLSVSSMENVFLPGPFAHSTVNQYVILQYFRDRSMCKEKQRTCISIRLLKRLLARNWNNNFFHQWRNLFPRDIASLCQSCLHKQLKFCSYSGWQGWLLQDLSAAGLFDFFRHESSPRYEPSSVLLHSTVRSCFPKVRKAVSLRFPFFSLKAKTSKFVKN